MFSLILKIENSFRKIRQCLLLTVCLAGVAMKQKYHSQYNKVVKRGLIVNT